MDRWFDLFFGEKFKQRFERLILILSIAGFLIHLLLIALHHWTALDMGIDQGKFFESPISALYTPFSFILIYEVYLLVEQLPRSFTSSVQKQFEIIALILIRRIFKDISHLNLGQSIFSSFDNQLLLLDLGVFLILFFLIYLFRRLQANTHRDESIEYNRFVRIKKIISIGMMPVLLGLIAYELSSWIFELSQFNAGLIEELTDVNKIFFQEFFMVLICVDVLILLISLNFIQNYSQLIRNSGYIVSTVLIRLSFTASGLANTFLILLGVAFGVALLYVYNLLENDERKA